MFPIFHAMLAAILGTGASATPAPHVPSGAKCSTLPVVTYGASALGQPAGGVEDSTNKNLKLKGEIKLDKETVTNKKFIKETGKEGKFLKVNVKDATQKAFPKVSADHKEPLNR